MVAHQAHRLEARERLGQDGVDHLDRRGAAVDIVADIDRHLARRHVGRVSGNPGVETFKEIGAAVDITDGIDPGAVGHPPGTSGRHHR